MHPMRGDLTWFRPSPAQVEGRNHAPGPARLRPLWVLRNGGREATARGETKENPTEGIFGQSKESAYARQLTVTAADPSNPAPLLPRLAAGDSGAMGECIDRYGPLVWGLVRRSVKDSTEAEDLVQEILTEVWKKAAFFDPRMASESTFIGMIARRRTIDHLRRQGRQPGFETLDAAESIPAPAAGPSPSQCDPEAVRACIATLPDDTRELFKMFFEDGFTHPEIAEKTGLPLGTVKTRLRRGLIALREQLQRTANPNLQPAS